ncbi:MAG: DNA polymerase/3'-5' exonuclease PolX [Candidatus Pacebacteria bacterium]|nr:DNA polymerase/3'-5' exonuclease PolX [Candidatus Paceibacterota bacterium]
MRNKELARIFYKISQYLRTENIPFKPQAYYKAGVFLDSLSTDIQEVYNKGGLKALEAMPSIGRNLALKIKEYLETGKIRYFEELRIPFNLDELTAVEGLGPKKAKKLYLELKVKNIKDLEKVAKQRKIRNLTGFDEKSEKNILQGIEFLKKDKGKFLLSEVLLICDNIISILRKHVIKIEPAGSIRRRKEIVKDIDLLAASKNPKKTMQVFCSQKGVQKIWSKGSTKASVKTKQGIDIDLRIVDLKSYGAALQYFTGSREHNIILRKMAKQKGFKLNEYGLFKNNRYIAGKTEEDIYEKLGLPWIPPELREQELIINIPELIDLKDIKGDLHCHTNWSAGKDSIEKMYEKAQKIGYEYLGISDHTKFLRIENGLDEKRLIKQSNYIKKLKEKGYNLLHGCEANILANGSLDIKNEVLKKLDYVIAGIHSGLNQDITERIIKAMQNPYVKIISHLTGRLIKKREESIMNFDKILKAAQKTNTILEINSSPQRLDIQSEYIKKVKEMKVRLIINSDAHETKQLENMQYGVFEARRGGLEKEHVLNTFSLACLTKVLKRIK